MNRWLWALVVTSSLPGFGGAQTISLSLNAPETINPSTATVSVPFSMTPAAGSFTAVGMASFADYSLGVAVGFLPIISSTPGNATEFLVTYRDVPPTGPVNGAADRVCSGTICLSATLVIEHVTPQVVAPNALVSTFVPAGHVLKLLSMTINTSGLQDLLVTGDPSLRWYLFDVVPPNNWRTRNQALANGDVGGPGTTVNLASGNYALVVARDGAVSSMDRPFTARLASASSHITLSGPGTSVGGLINPSYQFTMTPAGNRWNAVGIFGTLANGFTISMENATSGASGNSTGYVVANGHLGLISPTDGLLAHSGTLAGTLHEASLQTISVGSPGTMNWTSSSLIHVVEFEILTAASYDLSVTGSGGLGWALFSSNSSSWKPKSAAFVSAGVGTPQNGVNMFPGWFAIVVSKSGIGSPAGTITCSVGLSPNNPVPVLSSVSPDSAAAGGPGFTLSANGSQFVNGQSEVRWNGSPLATSFVSSGQLTAPVPASLIATTGTATVTVFTGLPGGGTSSGQTFAINNPVPGLASISPTFAIAGGPTLTLTLNGSGFSAGTIAFWNGVNLATTFVSSSQLTATVPAILIAAPGTAEIRAFNPTPGGGLSSPRSITIRSPSISQIVPASIPVLTGTSSPINVLISGADFLPTARAYADSMALPVFVLGSTLIQVSIGPSVPGVLRRGGLAIAVENGHLVPSNALALSVGGGSNQGTLVRHPLDPLPGEPYAVMLEDGFPFAPMVLIVDLVNPTPLHPFPNPAADFVLSVRPAGLGQPDWLLLTDSIGLFGVPFGPTYDASGELFLPGFVAPNPPLGISLTVQGAFLDPTAPAGYRITWPRFPDEL